MFIKNVCFGTLISVENSHFKKYSVHSDFQLCQNLPVRTTSSAGQQNRRDDECFLDWFSRRTSSESLGYNSSRQEDILCAFSKKMKATVLLNEDHRK